jgi:thiopeptide-type bacteriocin biosynthesis protein
MTDHVKRRFILGDEWIYFKIYSGPDTLESILIDDIYMSFNEFYRLQIVDKFFFIRYTDPEYHLRIRFHITNLSELCLIIQSINKKLQYYISNRLVWKFSTDTYNRELERYGHSTIEEIETLFGLDSLAVIEFLKQAEDASDDSIRWLWGFKYIDILLSKFSLSLNDKVAFFKMLSKGYSEEFNMNKALRIQMDRKYRTEMDVIDHTIGLEDTNSLLGAKIISFYIQQAESKIQRILNFHKQGKLEVPFESLLASLVHMHFNRLFRTKQRLHELVIYYFMHKFL